MNQTIWDHAASYWELDHLGVRPWASLPTGVTVHYTADPNLDRVKAHMLSERVGYHFIIDRAGAVHQTASLGRCVNHAGKAMWNGQSPNRTHLAVAFLSWGLLSKESKSWTGAPVIGVKREGNLWDPATVRQEESLIDLLQWAMREYGIMASNLCGHDECALPKGRKSDPGGSLSRSMGAIRKELST